MKTPYFTIQELLREIAKGFGTKNFAAKEIDDACKHNEINPHQFEKLKRQLVNEPLTRYVNESFADHISQQVDNVFENYLGIISSVPLDGVNADDVRAVLNKYFISYSVAYICSEIFERMRLTPQEVALSKRPMLELTLSYLKSSSTWREYLASCTDAQKDRLRVWSLGKGGELPDMSSIAAIGKQWKPGNDWGTLKARLIMARFWDYFFYRFIGTDLDIIRLVSPKSYQNGLIDTLVTLQQKQAIKYERTTPLAIELYDLLRLRKPKSLRDKRRCSSLLEKLHSEQSHLDQNNETTYYYHWMQARYYLHQGQLEQALGSYKLAFEQSIYRAGKNTECIVKESLLIACRLKSPKKSFINRLRRMAVILQLDMLPISDAPIHKKKPEEIESWEISTYAKYFNTYFTKDSFFPDAIYPELYQPNYGVWMIDEERYVLDLRKPDKSFKVGLDGGLVKKMPQLVYFAMNDDIDSVVKLLDAGADVNKLSQSNETSLLMAVQKMQVNLVPLNSMNQRLFNLISSKPHTPETLNAVTTKRKLTALGCAVQTGRLEVVKKVVELGADVNKRHDVGNESPLFTCICLLTYHTRPAVPRVMGEIMKYSDQNLQSVRAFTAGLLPHDKEHLIKVLDEQERNPVYCRVLKAAKEYEANNIVTRTSADEFRQIAKLLIEKGADPNAKHDTALLGYTPMMLAAEMNESELFEAMLKAGGNINDTCVDPIRHRRVGYREIARHWKSVKVLELLQ